VNPDVWLYIAMVMGVAALVLAAFYGRQVIAVSPGNDRMVYLMGAIREGSMTFMRREYTAIAGFVAIMSILIYALLDWGRPWGAVAYVFGAVLSATAGFIGMRIATAANARTAEAARQGGTAQALPVAFRGGAVMGFTVAGLGLLGFSLASVPRPLLCSLVSEAVSTRRPLTSALTSSARLKLGSLRTTLEIQPRSRTTSVTTLAMSPAWVPTSSSPMSVRSSLRSLSPRSCSQEASSFRR